MGIATLERSRPRTARAFRGNDRVTRNPNSYYSDTLLCSCERNTPNGITGKRRHLKGPEKLVCDDAEKQALVARCKVTAIFSANIRYQTDTRQYLYNLRRYLAEKVWSERRIIPYFAPSTTRKPLETDTEIAIEYYVLRRRMPGQPIKRLDNMPPMHD